MQCIKCEHLQLCVAASRKWQPFQANAASEMETCASLSILTCIRSDCRSYGAAAEIVRAMTNEAVETLRRLDPMWSAARLGVFRLAVRFLSDSAAP